MKRAIRDWLVRAPFAHRGLHGPDTGPENSLAAFAAAVDRGYGIECDVRLLADGEVVVFHDRDTARLTGRPGPMAALHASDLAALFLGGTAGHPPLLRDVLALVAGRVPLYIELKTDDRPARPLVRRVLALLAGYAGPCCLASFDPRALALVAVCDPGRVRCLIASDGVGEQRSSLGRLLRRYLFHALLARPNVIAYDVRAMPNAAVSLARFLGLPVLLWTVRTREDMDKALRLGDNVVFEGCVPPSPGNT